MRGVEYCARSSSIPLVPVVSATTAGAGLWAAGGRLLRRVAYNSSVRNAIPNLRGRRLRTAVFYPDDRMIRRGPSGSAERAPGFGNRVPHARPQRGHHSGRRRRPELFSTESRN